MNDTQIRQSFHLKRLHKHHADPNTLIIDELGLKHGKCRADIAVINSHITGYEIKSDEDSLCRLDKQIDSYSKVFDRATVVVSAKHVDIVYSRVPDWWGIIVTHQGYRGNISFETLRKPSMNREIDLLSVAQLLWSNEASSILIDLGVPQRVLRQRRSFLYQYLVDLLGATELRSRVRECLKNRRNWRCRVQPSPDGGSSQPFAK